ncbi:hypothetical protein Hanom_Chr01g00072551 [Helianthus anomalus]
MILLALTLEQLKHLLEHATVASAISSHLVLQLTPHAVNPMQDFLNLRRRHHRRRWRWLVLLRLRWLWLLVTRRVTKNLVSRVMSGYPVRYCLIKVLN